MDKYEYKLKAEEIKQLISEGSYALAAEIADTIDWRRVKSVMMLCTISDLYKINRRYEDARDMLLLAYEKRPGGRTICYSLCELSLKTGEYVQAVEYYKEFVQVASTDPGRYILQYKIYAAQEVSLEERIAVLEELKKRDYREKWAYELAYLYHRVGLATRCVEECDELILWFGEGKYVVKAMELKMLHQPLTPEQQEYYDHRFDEPAQQVEQEASQQQEAFQEEYQVSQGDTQVFQVPDEDELDISVKTMDVGEYNTINLQAELAAGLKEVLDGENVPEDVVNFAKQEEKQQQTDTDTDFFDTFPMEEVDENISQEDALEKEQSEIFYDETGELTDLGQEYQEDYENGVLLEEGVMPEERNDLEEPVLPREGIRPVESDLPGEGMPAQEGMTQELSEIFVDEFATEEENSDVNEGLENSGNRELEQQVLLAQPPKEIASVLSQEPDGQISLVVPEKENLEKQITGQMSIEDILTEWERMKKQNQEKREQEVRRHVMEHTGDMFTEFEAAIRDGLLEKLESEANANVVAEATSAQDDFFVDESNVSEENPVEEQSSYEEDFTEEYEEIDGVDTALDEDEVEELEEIQDTQEEVLPEEDFSEEQEEVVEEVSEYEEEILLDAEEELPEEPSQKTEEEILTSEEETILEEMEEVIPEEITQEGQEDILEEESKEEASEPIFTKEYLPNTEEIPETLVQEMLAEKAQEDKVTVAFERKETKEKDVVRKLTKEERELYEPFIQSQASREQLINAIDNISLASYTGNLVITGEEGIDTVTLAKNVVREIQAADSNFSGKVAKISGESLNKRDIPETLEKLKNGALIIEKSAGMNEDTIKTLYRTLQKENMGIVVILEDTRKRMNRLLDGNENLTNCFTARIDVEALSNDALVAFGRKYAKELEFSIDDLGILALHTRIEYMQTSDHIVTIVDVKDIVDEAIAHAKRKTFGHFIDILVGKRYDDEDMIILSEKDFV